MPKKTMQSFPAMRRTRNTVAKRCAPIAALLCAIAIVVLPVKNAAGADAYPSRPVRIVVMSTPSSGPDILARLLSRDRKSVV